MATYVLVHGAWTGSFAYRKVRPLLAGAGHDVFTPSLTGLGERAHLTSPQVTLETHVQDVVNVVLYEDLTDLVLVGFSYGGMVVTGALEHIAERVRHLVYLDAFVPEDGDSLDSLTGRDRTGLEVRREWLVPPSEREFDDPADAEFVGARRLPHPVGCFTEPVRLSRPLEEHTFGLTYIRASAEQPSSPGATAIAAAASRAKSSPAWRYREIDTTHMVPINRPRELAELLLELA
jgi:pimeloyl-ACP methyl ester carboxylesterase